MEQGRAATLPHTLSRLPTLKGSPPFRRTRSERATPLRSERRSLVSLYISNTDIKFHICISLYPEIGKAIFGESYLVLDKSESEKSMSLKKSMRLISCSFVVVFSLRACVLQ